MVTRKKRKKKLFTEFNQNKGSLKRSESMKNLIVTFRISALMFLEKFELPYKRVLHKNVGFSGIWHISYL